MSEDRNKHDRAGRGSRDGMGHHVGRTPEERRGKAETEGKAGMSQHIPDKVRGKIDGSQGKPPKGGKRR